MYDAIAEAQISVCIKIALKHLQRQKTDDKS